MAVRKVSHHKRITSKTGTTFVDIRPGQIIEFKYRNKNNDNYDKKPMVFILQKTSNILNGININYMKEYKVQRLLEETNFKNLKYYSLYEDFFRTYSRSQIKRINIVEYETKKEQRIDNRIEVDEKLKDVNLEKPKK